jgi:DNA polymerase III delta prime subunit
MIFYEKKKIPHIIFHGPSGSGKRTIVHDFINIIYKNNKENIKNFVMYVDCSQGKGIKFIREDVKLFSKTHIHSIDGNMFKSIILLNADKLTLDAQSALRRCIELFSHNTRFFIIAEDKYKLIKPILSRFCEIFVPQPTIKGLPINLYNYNLNKTFQLNDIKTSKINSLKKELTKIMNLKDINIEHITELSSKLYEKGFSALDILELLENTTFFNKHISLQKKIELLLCFHKIKSEFRNEKLLMLFIFNFIFLSLDVSLENIHFM